MALLLATLPEQAIQTKPAIRAEYRGKGRFKVVDGTTLVFNQQPAEVILLVGESAARLRQLPAASGARNGSGSQILWIKGDHASGSIGSAPPLPWEPHS